MKPDRWADGFVEMDLKKLLLVCSGILEHFLWKVFDSRIFQGNVHEFQY